MSRETRGSGSLSGMMSMATFSLQANAASRIKKLPITPRKNVTSLKPALSMSSFQSMQQRKSPTRALNPHHISQTKQIGVSLSTQKMPTARMSVQSKSNNTLDPIAAKYSNEYPKVELHPHDTRRFRLYYAAPSQAPAAKTVKPPVSSKKPHPITSLSYGSSNKSIKPTVSSFTKTRQKTNSRPENSVDFGNSSSGFIDLRASSKQARDLITLLIRCFSAQAQFLNSKIIESVVGNNNNRASFSDKSLDVDLEDDEDEMRGVDESATETNQVAKKLG